MKPLSIDALVRWAYVNELPKAQAVQGFLRPDTWSQPWSVVTRTGMLGTEVQEPDVRNRYGLVPDLQAQSGPHDDAIAVWAAVEALAGMTVTVPDGWDPLGELAIAEPYRSAAIAKAIDRMCYRIGGPVVAKPAGASVRSWRVVRSEDARKALRKPATEIVVKSAIMGKPPDCSADQPTLRTVLDNGKPKWFVRDTIQTENGAMEIEVDGMDRKRRMPKPGAYVKQFYDPDPCEVVQARAEYEIWHASMGALQEELRGRLAEHEVLPTSLPSRPWEDEAVAATRVLPDGRPPRLPMRVQRPRAGPPPVRGITVRECQS